MWLITIIFGAILTVLGIAGYVWTEMKSLTALIPSVIGLLLLVCGVLARNERLRMHVMHAAVLVGLAGVIGPLIRVAMKLEAASDLVQKPAILLSVLTSLLCLVFVGLCVNSFVQARLARRRPAHPEAHSQS